MIKLIIYSEIHILNTNLDEANKKYNNYAEEKNELVNVVEGLQEMVNKLNRDKGDIYKYTFDYDNVFLIFK